MRGKLLASRVWVCLDVFIGCCVWVLLVSLLFRIDCECGLGLTFVLLICSFYLCIVCLRGGILGVPVVLWVGGRYFWFWCLLICCLFGVVDVIAWF